MIPYRCIEVYVDKKSAVHNQTCVRLEKEKNLDKKPAAFALLKEGKREIKKGTRAYFNPMKREKGIRTNGLPWDYVSIGKCVLVHARIRKEILWPVSTVQ